MRLSERTSVATILNANHTYSGAENQKVVTERVELRDLGRFDCHLQAVDMHSQVVFMHMTTSGKTFETLLTRLSIVEGIPSADSRYCTGAPGIGNQVRPSIPQSSELCAENKNCNKMILRDERLRLNANINNSC